MYSSFSCTNKRELNTNKMSYYVIMNVLTWVLTALLVFIMALLVMFSHWRGWRTYWMMRGLPKMTRFPLITDPIFLASIKQKDLFKVFEEHLKGYRYRSAFLLGLPSLTIYHPDDVEIILGSTVNIKKGYEYFPLRTWLQEGLLLSDGSKWRQRRKLLTPTFHFSILEENVGQIASHTKVFIQKLLETEGKPIIIENIIRHYTLDVICETAMGIKLDAQLNKSTGYVAAIERSLNTFMERIIKIWLYRDWAFNLTPGGKIFHQDMQTLHEFTEEVINARKKELPEQQQERKRKAFLDLLLQTEESNPGILTPLGIREEVDTFMFEGHDTTSAAIVHALYSLATNPEIQEKCYEEQEQIFGTDQRECTKQDLQEMSYLEMFIKEVLRLYPSVPIISRTLTKDATLGDGRVIPAGMNVLIQSYMIHRREEFWDNPSEFRPERFLPGVSRHPYSYIPFSAGPRNCIGMKFAILELKMTLAAVVRYFKVEPVTKELNLMPNIILRNHEPIQVRILPRSQINANK